MRRRYAFLRGRRDPFAAFPGRYAHHIHHVHFFKRLPFALEYKEVDYEYGCEKAPGEHIAISEIDISRDKRRKEPGFPLLAYYCIAWGLLWTCPIRKFHSQFEAVAMAIALAR